MSRYIAAAVQLDTREDWAANLASAKELIREAASRGAKIVALPENWTYQGHDYLDYAEDMPGGRVCGELFCLAKELGIWIHSGSFSQKSAEDKRPSNTTMLIDPQGKIVAKYDKMHVFDVDVEDAGSFRESDSKKPGDEMVVADTELGRLGLSICYDVRFPELYRLMALAGAEVFFVPASFLLRTGKDHWEPLLKARAIENSCYVIAPCQCGVKYDGPTYGRSLIIDPWGTSIAAASERPCVITAEIDLDFRKKVARQLLTLENIRRDVYTLSLNE